MKVRIRSGSQTGAVVEMGQSEGESAISTGYAEAYVAPAIPKAPAVQSHEEPKRGKKDRD